MVTVLVALMYKDGKGVTQDDFKAVKYWQKACGLKVGRGCFNLGVMYANGKGVRQGNTEILNFFGKACDLKLPLGCKNYARLKKIMH